MTPRATATQNRDAEPRRRTATENGDEKAPARRLRTPPIASPRRVNRTRPMDFHNVQRPADMLYLSAYLRGDYRQ